MTDLARLRGWSTSWPLAVAISHAKTCRGTVATSGCISVGTARGRQSTPEFGDGFYFGVYADVVTPGRIHIGDEVTVVD